MHFSAKLAVMVLATAALAGCNTVPIMNVADAPAASATGRPLSAEQVRGAIVRAGAALGWQMKDEGPNMMVGTIHLRTHTAVVEIPYSARAYSVRYRSSVNLDEKDGSIHKNYNGWIQNLTRGINAQLSAS
jgi:type IV pilus biogenesis protein CpaD/CtpE